MFNRNTRSDVNAGVDEINQDISRLADTLEGVLKSWGSDAKGEADVARRKAESLLRETRARMHLCARAPAEQPGYRRSGRDLPRRAADYPPLTSEARFNASSPALPGNGVL